MSKPFNVTLSIERMPQSLSDLELLERWLLLRRWHHLAPEKRQTLTALFAGNRRRAKAYLLCEEPEGLWTYTYAGAGRRLKAT